MKSVYVTSGLKVINYGIILLIPHNNRAAISQHEANRLQHHERKEELFSFSSLSLAQSSKSNNNSDSKQAVWLSF